MPSSDLKLTSKERRLLLDLAQETLFYGSQHGRVLAIDLAHLPPALHRPRASFVTLEQQERLRGCIGSLIPRRPLAEDVVANAFAAAFSDPRFPPVRLEEIADLSIHISILSPLEFIPCASEAELIAQLCPRIDGLVLEERHRRATFLPAVWDALPEPRDFLAQLKMKAGLPADYWSPEIKAYRYTVEVIRSDRTAQPSA
ncbi:hypothetical protein JCM13664_07880 [Methylothermus subterraneus]